MSNARSSTLTARIGPSILNANLSSLAEESRKLLTNGADYLHLDVMDGHFVPNLTFGHPLVACLRKEIPEVSYDMHMMVSQPLNWIQPMADALDVANTKENYYTFHYEAVKDAEECHRCIRAVKEAGMKVGLAIKPNTPVKEIFPFVNDVHMILVMTVEPGFGGQSFMPNMMEKVLALRELHPLLDIEVDGGVGENTIHDCAKAGANMIVSGTGVVKALDQREVMRQMKTVVSQAIQARQLER